MHDFSIWLHPGEIVVIFVLRQRPQPGTLQEMFVNQMMVGLRVASHQLHDLADTHARVGCGIQPFITGRHAFSHPHVFPAGPV